MNDEMIKEPYLFDEDEASKEIKRLKDWGEYYKNLYDKFKKPKHQEKLIKIVRKIKMVFLGLSEDDLKHSMDRTGQSEEQIFKQLNDLQDDYGNRFRESEFIETGTRKVNREIVKPKPFLKPVIDEIMRDIKIGKATFKADIKMSIDTGQLKRSITGKKDGCSKGD